MKALLTVTLASIFAAPLFATTPAPVPEPGTMALVGGGIAIAILVVRRNRKK